MTRMKMYCDICREPIDHQGSKLSFMNFDIDKMVLNEYPITIRVCMKCKLEVMQFITFNQWRARNE